jgi:23S rRNA pseudouridine1911/1915/1917 synthase
MTVHPAAGTRANLVHAILGYHPDMEEWAGRARASHRLDKDTSGLILVAKNDRATAGYKISSACAR